MVQPAYAALSEGLHSLETSTNADSTASETTTNAASGKNNSAHNGLPKGLALLPDGKTYYLHLLFSETGSSRSEKSLCRCCSRNSRKSNLPSAVWLPSPLP